MTTFIWIVSGVGALALYIIVGSYIESLPKRRLEAKKKKERWGEFINQPSSKDNYWALGRSMMNVVNGKRPSSIPYLESLGFKFLGYSNEVLLWVEPPAGWRKVGEPFTCWSNIMDETGKVRFQQFYKNDIMNPSDYRAEIAPID